MTRSLFFLILLLSTLCTHAQTLPRKGSLGAQLQNAPDGTGVQVVRVFPGTSAASMGVQQGDVIVGVDETPVHAVGDVVALMRDRTSGSPLTVRIQRAGRTKQLRGRVVGRPLETSAHGTVVYGEVPFDHGALRSILALPLGVEKPPVVLWLPGVGCYSQDYFADPRSPYKQWVEGLLQRGIAVYRVEKPGMGDSRTTTQCTDMDFDHEVAAYTAALAHLRTVEAIDPARIHLYGHSMGVLSMPRVAASGPVASMIAWGGVATSWFEYELRLIRDQQALEGKDPIAIEQDVRARLPLLADFYVNNKPLAEIAQDTAHAAVLEAYYDGRLWHGLQHPSFFQDLGQMDVLAAYAATDAPLLALAGACDLHTIDTTWAPTLVAAVERVRPGTARHVVVPQTTHHYHTVPSMADYMRMQQEGGPDNAYMADHFNHEVPRLIAEWVLEKR